MNVPNDHPLTLALAINRPETARAAIQAALELPQPWPLAIIQALIEQVQQPCDSQSAILAIRGLRTHPESPLTDVVEQTWIDALRSSLALVRFAVLETLANHRDHQRFRPQFAETIANDESWINRRLAMQAWVKTFTKWDDPDFDVFWTFADDPHWRVRHAFVNILHNSTESESKRQQWLNRLDQCPSSQAQGVKRFLAWRWGLDESDAQTQMSLLHPLENQPWWDWDPAVLARELNRLRAQDWIDQVTPLVAHDEERVRSLALQMLKDAGHAQHWVSALREFQDFRREGALSLREALIGLDLTRLEQIRDQLPDHPIWTTWFNKLFRYAEDDHPGFVKGDDLQQAKELVNNPTEATSWISLRKAARQAKVPIWKLEPLSPWRPEPKVTILEPDFELRHEPNQWTRLLGPDDWRISPLGISGHYGLSVSGFAKAIEAGVNVLFWEPNYQTLSNFAARLSINDRKFLHFLVGTFECVRKQIRKDVEHALKQLKIDQIHLFLLFWTRSWTRIDHEVRHILETLVQEGKIARYGLSTHNRELAIQAINQGWNPVMVRHSAAHRKAEELIFPHAQAQGTSLITFNNTCYGRLLKPIDHLTPPSAADCYRYAMSQPNVRLCLSAPANLDQLDENLQALHDPILPDERRKHLLDFGQRLYQQEIRFRRWVREV